MMSRFRWWDIVSKQLMGGLVVVVVVVVLSDTAPLVPRKLETDNYFN